MIGQDGKVVFVRHGSIYVRVHPCRLIRCGNEFNEEIAKQINDKRKSESDTKTDVNVVDDDSEDEQNDNMPVENDNAQEPVAMAGENNRNHRPPDQAVMEDEHIVEDNDQPGDDVVEVQRNNQEQDRKTKDKTAKDIPRIGDNIVYRTKGDETWVKAKVVSRGGKATGKNWAYLNVQNDNDDSRSGVNFVKDVEEWHNMEEVDDVNAVVVPISRHDEEKVKNAKRQELDNWRLFGVYEEVPYTGQCLMSTRWVITEKETGGNRTLKARLVVRGFEEDYEVKTDSPTVHKESLRLFLAITSTCKYKINSIDIKAAFLQGKDIDRVIFIQPPKECLSDKAMVWKLKKCVYGLVDASRNWFLSVKKELLQLSCVQSKLDPALFLWHYKGNLEGMFLMHVDDFLWAGSESFKNNVICHIRRKFHCGKEMDSSFRYIGLNIEQDDWKICLHQNDYIEELKQVDRTSKLYFKDNKNGIFPELVGQLHWIASQTRPDLCFDVLDLSTLTDVSDSKLQSKLNKVIRKAKNNLCSIVFPCLESLHDIELLLYADASYANLSDQISSAGGYIIFLKGTNDKVCPISWAAKKIKRVVKSTLAAEALSLVEGLDACYFVRSILQEMFNSGSTQSIPIRCFTDNKSLCQNIHSTKLISEKRLRLDLASIKESVSQGDVSVEWIRTSGQISDCMTKAGADFHHLMEIISTGNGP